MRIKILQKLETMFDRADSRAATTRELYKRYADRSHREIADLFGKDFAEQLAALDPQAGDGWQGPIPSAYGYHLVRLSGRTPSRDPLLAEVADAVRRDYLQQRRRDANETFYRRLRERYDVKFSEPPAE